MEIVGCSLAMPKPIRATLHEIADSVAPASFSRDGIALREASVTARGLLAVLLSMFSGRPIGSFSLATGPSGKPVTKSGQGNSENPETPAFSLSYSDNHVVFALLLGSLQVGIDLEKHRRLRNLEDIIDYAFSQSEGSALVSLEARRRPACFFQVWCRKEAVVKALGQTVAAFMDQFSVFPSSRGWVGPRFDDPGLERLGYRVCDLDLPREYSGALCVAGCEPEIRYHRLEARQIGWAANHAIGRSYIR